MVFSHSRRRGQPVEREWRQHHNEGVWREVQEERKQESVPRGVCLSMCPVRELQDRETQNLLHRFEVLAGTEREHWPRADPSRVVKEYARPAAGKDSTRPSDLRPPAVLLKTVFYLIDNIAASPTLRPWTEASHLHCMPSLVRQDMIIQRVSGADCVAVLERTIRFLIYASYRLCGEPLRLYDPRINDTHLQESLSWLLDCYTKRIRSSPVMRLALSVSRAFMERNPVRLFRLAHSLNFLQSCALHRHLEACRRDLLLLYSHGHSSKNCRFPLHKLAHILALDVPLTTQLCQAHGVEVHGDSVVFSKTSFTEPEAGKLQCAHFHELVDRKQSDLTVGSIIHGCT
ncbi:unnamed protein product [Coregonus sp. 'balchen']|nr:unnamed protein product [Coregonus sp. 'balchen']